ncbi:Abi family protein [Acetobacter pasteurianus]|uniref:Abi family protein n=1 Tax=Acetobacter pasteurianus TaxID=438 RepID=A0A0S3JPG4_ACEPA|nr:Abi family protein [Acetobacter pasteurianus]ALR88306.1 hypothetical protein DB34_14160 [Acetobacter pasteurianus]
MTVKNFPLSEPVLQALQTSLSPERFSTYLRASDGHQEQALRLYTHNTALSAAFYGPLQGLEIAVRNALHRELTARFGPAWYDNRLTGLNPKAQDQILRAKRDVQREHRQADPPHVVASLSFGFWVALLGKGGNSNYEMILWRPALAKAFPHARLGRKQAHQQLDYLRTFRNRIAHHEPIFTRHLAADHEAILRVTGWICPLTRDWIASHSRVPTLLAQPASADLLF